MIELYVEEEKKTYRTGATLKVIGIGGAGSNAVNSMVDGGEMPSVEYLVANTDAQALQASPAMHKIQLGAKITKGLGAGSNPDTGRRAAEEDLDTIAQHIENTDILFLTAGLGGGTGSGGLPVIAQVAREMGILTVAIVTKPFVFEGRRRLKIAEEAVKVMKSTVDTLIVVPNQRLLEIVDAKISMLDAFALSNDILKQAIKGISDIIMKSGHINVDFADVKTIMKDMGMALMGTGRASGEGRARQAALNAISSPLLENVSIKGAQGVLINITGNVDLGLYEINEAASLVYELVSEEANIILGSVIDTEVGDEVLVTVIATGFEQEEACTHEAKNVTLASKKTSMNQPSYCHPELDSGSNPSKQTPSHFSAKKEIEYVSPASIKQSEQKIENKEDVLQVMPSKSDIVDELDDLDTPTFLRRKMEMQQHHDEYEKSMTQEEQ